MMFECVIDLDFARFWSTMLSLYIFKQEDHIMVEVTMYMYS